MKEIKTQVRDITDRVLRIKIEGTLKHLIESLLNEAVNNLIKVSTFPGGSASISHGDDRRGATLTVAIEEKESVKTHLVHLEMVMDRKPVALVGGELTDLSSEELVAVYWFNPPEDMTVTDATVLISHWRSLTLSLAASAAAVAKPELEPHD